VTYQPPPFQVPTPPPQKKNRIGYLVGGFVGTIVLCCVVGSIAMNGNSKNNSTSNGSTSSQSSSAKWTTVQTFDGTGGKKTPTFHIGNTWRINWTCTPGSFHNIDYNLAIFLYSSDASMMDVPLNTICKKDNASGQTDMHKGGDVYLDVNSEGDWKLEIQELK
jgi:hypothetical protein